MNDVYNYILIQDLKKLPKHGQTKKQVTDAFKGASDQLELSSQIAVLEKFQEITTKVIKSLSVLEIQASGVQKAFNLTVDESKELALVLDKVGISQKINTRLAKQYIADLGKSLPGQIKNIAANKQYNTELQVTNDVLRNKLKLDGKQAFSIRKLAAAQDKSVSEIIINAEKVNKKLIQEEGYAGGLYDILSEIGNLNNEVAIQYGQGIPEQLERSVIAAKKFGLTLNDLYNSGQKLLDVEHATTKAVEFQIFSGKRLEGQKYKNIAASYNQATIEGDSATQIDIITDLVRTQGETMRGTNMLAKKALADSVNLTVSQLQEIYTRDKEYAKIGTAAIRKMEGEDEEAFQKRKEKFEEEQEAKAIAHQDELNNVIAIGKERSMLSTEEKADIPREIEKSKLVADAGVGLSSADMVAGSETLMNTLVSAQTSKVGSFAAKILQITGGVKFTATSAKNLADALKPFQDPSSEAPGGQVVKNEDAFIRVNDAIMFDPNDKINIMASTSQGSLDKTTANMAGGSSNNTSNIGQQVAAALAGMSFVVNNSFNGEDIISQMEIIQENKMN